MKKKRGGKATRPPALKMEKEVVRRGDGRTFTFYRFKRKATR